MMKIILPLMLLSIMPAHKPKDMAPPMFMLAAALLMYLTPAQAITPSLSIYLDKLSLSLMMLTLWITALMLLVAPPKKSYLANLTIMLLTICLLITFSTSNLMTFYIFFEASLLPTMLIILTWGPQPERLNAAMYFFMYTFITSLFLLFTVFIWNTSDNSLFMHEPLQNLWSDGGLMKNSSHLWGLLVLAPFLVKVPIYSLHLWLPKAHVEAPLAGSMILASVLLKLGGYGLIRLNKLLMYWSSMEHYKNFLYSTAIVGTTMASLACLNQSDMKALIAYSSVAHMGPMLVAIMTMTSLGTAAATIIMISHGLTSSCLFVLANENYVHTGSRSLALNKGSLTLMPTLAMVWFILLATNMSTPPFLNFFGEIMSFPPLMMLNPMNLLPIIFGIFFTGAYTLLLYSNNNHGGVPMMTLHMAPPSSKLLFVITMHLSPLALLVFNMNSLT